jgi:hypothetical protein
VHSEAYTFITVSDDGVRLWVNGQMLIEDWTQHSVEQDSGKIALVASHCNDIKLEYFEQTGVAEIHLLWSSPSIARQLIPSTRLYPAP